MPTRKNNLNKRDQTAEVRESGHRRPVSSAKLDTLLAASAQAPPSKKKLHAEMMEVIRTAERADASERHPTDATHSAIRHASMAPYYPKTCRLSHCSALYAASLADPFNVHGVCIPSTPCFPSKKQTFWTKGSFTTTTTLGWIFANPFAGISNATCVYSTDGAATVTPTTKTLIAGTQHNTTNSPWAPTDFSGAKDKIRWRLVSAGLRIRYVGTELNRGGDLVGYVEPNNLSLDVYGKADFLAKAGTHVSSVGREWHSVVYAPSENEYGMVSFSSAEPPSYTVMGVSPAPMGFFVTAPGVASSYEFEFFINAELIGSPVADSMTRMNADPVGFSAIFDTITDAYNHYYKGSGKEAAKRLITGAANTLAGYSAAGVPGATVAAGKEVGSWLYSSLEHGEL